MSDHRPVESKPRSRFLRAFSKPALLILGLGIFSLLLAGGGTYVWAEGYEGKIGPNVFVGDVDISGVDPEIARQRIQKRVDEIITDGVSVVFEGKQKTLPLATIVSGDLLEDVEFDIAAAIDEALSLHKQPHAALSAASLAKQLVTEQRLSVPVTVYEEEVKERVRELFPEDETEMQNAAFRFSFGSEWTVEIEEEQDGYTFAFEPFFAELQNRLETLEYASIPIQMSAVEPEINSDDAEAAIETALAVLDRAPFTFTFEDDWGYTRKYLLSTEELTKLLRPSTNEEFPVEIDEAAFHAFVETFAEQVEQPAQNARFEIVDGRVTEFLQSKPGRSIDREALHGAFMETLRDPEAETVIAMATAETEAEVKTGEVNDLGVTEILGVGTSSYRGSPRNRILNIQNGIRLLNGRLIAPGETFSLINALKPFTFENGYLPELVIKGDKIEPELGGGLCQIGSTTFRATMNSGLPVAERRNHSLVVSYYNDPTNGNPGTDATLYEPAPDYKFTNDTENHVLFQAEMLPATQELRFTFWGTNDGRKGSYTPPVVHRWIGVGEERVIETTDLEPGARECQEAHVGADASFTYSIVRPDGTVEEEIYESHYRPLPRICLVGVEEGAEEGSEGEETGGFAEFPPGFTPAPTENETP